jgi:hypothetical protein
VVTSGRNTPARPGGSAIDCYVQLPPEPPASAIDAVQRIGPVAWSLFVRFDALARLAGWLAPEAEVLVLVEPSLSSSPARLTLDRLLIEAILADRGRRGVRVVMLDGTIGAAAIAAVALGAFNEDGFGYRPIRTTAEPRPLTRFGRAAGYRREPGTGTRHRNALSQAPTPVPRISRRRA